MSEEIKNAYKVFGEELERIKSIKEKAELISDIAVEMLTEDNDLRLAGKPQKHSGHSDTYLLQLALDEVLTHEIKKSNNNNTATQCR